MAMDLKHEFQTIMDGTSGTPPGVALGDLARHLARSGQHISITALLGDGAPREWRAVASSVVHLAMRRGDDAPAPKVLPKSEVFPF